MPVILFIPDQTPWRQEKPSDCLPIMQGRARPREGGGFQAGGLRSLLHNIEPMRTVWTLNMSSDQIFYRFTHASMPSNRRLNRQAHLGIEVIQELLAYSLRVPPFTILLRPSQGEFLALSPVNETSISTRHINFFLSKHKGRSAESKAPAGPAIINRQCVRANLHL